MIGTIEEVYIFHEYQESSLCGQHCLNNLMQKPLFNSIELSEIALELDETERELLGSSRSRVSRKSENVDATGNFSYEVLRIAIERKCNLTLISWTSDEGQCQLDPTLESAFIINREYHWFTIRKIKDNWWNLDSMLEKPSHISPFYLTALLSEYLDERCSIFLVHGNIPEAGYLQDINSSNTTSEYPTGIWWEQSRLLSPSYIPTTTINTSISYPYNLNNNNRNRNSNIPSVINRLSHEYYESFGEGVDEDTLLAMALSASLNEAHTKK